MAHRCDATCRMGKGQFYQPAFGKNLEKMVRNRLHTRRELLKAFLALPGAAIFPGIGFSSSLMASQNSEIKTAGDIGVADRIVEQQNRAATNIKVVGVGGAGKNVVDLMIHEGLQGVGFVCVDTDDQTLRRSSARTKILLGHNCGAAGKPEIARDLAIEARSRISRVLHGADVAFIVAGLGGGTGTGAAPIVAGIARELGIMTIATVITPFGFEVRRLDLAMTSANELNRITDALILVPNERIVKAAGNETSFGEVLRLANRQLGYAIKSLVDNVHLEGMINLELDDLRSVMTGAGLCATGSATACGDDRARIATMSALYSPPMTVLYPPRRKFVVFNIASGRELAIREVFEVFRTLRRNFSSEATILGGAVFDDGLKDQLRVTLVAGG